MLWQYRNMILQFGAKFRFGSWLVISFRRNMWARLAQELVSVNIANIVYAAPACDFA